MAKFSQEFKTITLDQVHDLAVEKKRDGWRYVQMLAVLCEDGTDLVYSYMKDGLLENDTVKVQKDQVVPSISDVFLEAFVFENETHDLFDVNISDIVIDFGGQFYQLSQKAPMTIISPEKLAAQEKAKKIAAAKAAKEAKAKAAAKPAGEVDAALEAKLAAMDPEKAAKVRAAMEAKAKKEAAAAAKPANGIDEALEAKLAAMDPEKAAKVRAAMEAKAKKEAAAAAKPASTGEIDEALEAKLAAMDPEKAAKVRAAMAAKAAKAAKEAEGQGE